MSLAVHRIPAPISNNFLFFFTILTNLKVYNVFRYPLKKLFLHEDCKKV